MFRYHPARLAIALGRWYADVPVARRNGRTDGRNRATRSAWLPDAQAEYSIEIDPREASAETIGVLRELGFNRLSFGVQDFDLRVQQAVNRVQPLEMTQTVMSAARAEGFKSVSVDLIYGLPYQTVGEL